MAFAGCLSRLCPMWSRRPNCQVFRGTYWSQALPSLRWSSQDSEPCSDAEERACPPPPPPALDTAALVAGPWPPAKARAVGSHPFWSGARVPVLEAGPRRTPEHFGAAVLWGHPGRVPSLLWERGGGQGAALPQQAIYLFLLICLFYFFKRFFFLWYH